VEAQEAATGRPHAGGGVDVGAGYEEEGGGEEAGHEAAAAAARRGSAGCSVAAAAAACGGVACSAVRGAQVTLVRRPVGPARRQPLAVRRPPAVPRVRHRKQQRGRPLEGGARQVAVGAAGEVSVVKGGEAAAL